MGFGQFFGVNFKDVMVRGPTAPVLACFWAEASDCCAAFDYSALLSVPLCRCRAFCRVPCFLAEGLIACLRPAVESRSALVRATVLHSCCSRIRRHTWKQQYSHASECCINSRIHCCPCHKVAVLCVLVHGTRGLSTRQCFRGALHADFCWSIIRSCCMYACQGQVLQACFKEPHAMCRPCNPAH